MIIYSCTEGENMKLSKGKVGKTYIVSKVNGSDETRTHLYNLGIETDEMVTLISKIATNFVIGVKDGRFGIDERIAKLIEVHDA